ncbi:ribosomal protein S15 [Halobacteroides halobius DSM 5150]|uniref:Small ribosomal subunit protein uS15 n=1 Tax=Halobacteroides halobius (strain ATCC 35273 / DSM 5150 / MD-1) TaxID=748449 RepID=L0K805_HALHC|nr:30S ribosomal protein S15 [Halobacteroides halobius]AGB40680.1 ribosomal protein S15 [Halobacteroides halobius DSM 5150]
MLSKEKRQEIIEEYGVHENDTGSAQVQVALLTARIDQLTDHLENNHQDHDSRRGLMKMVGKRKKFLTYLKNNKIEVYRELIGKLGLRG